MKRPSPETLAEGVRAGTRAMMGRAITLVESSRAADRDDANALLERLAPHAGGSIRVGITGSPGVGKSTLIETFGRQLTSGGHRVAVLAVDPSSDRTGGSILGDKTRMTELARDPNAFIRPSPSGGTLGGVARRTRETMTVCEAAGYDVVLVETVGVGQSEVMVAGMVDMFVVLVLPGSGDELQGIKRGILELADLLVVTKADGDALAAARRTCQQHANALRLIPPKIPVWTPKAMTCSALTGEGVDTIWTVTQAFRDGLRAAGLWDDRRREQRVRWMWRALEDGVRDAVHQDPAVRSKLRALEPEVRAGVRTPDEAAALLLTAFRGG
ncbi:MAG: methylmalonyl Co-A mutase-associated GTPase MeaB [Nannocystaceae bacterium]|nr:methylmalonyl Co-A mutase-associated GTPase MeaB [bacterium]